MIALAICVTVYLTIGVALTAWGMDKQDRWRDLLVEALVWPIAVDIIVIHKLEMRRIERRAEEEVRKIREGG